MCIRDSPGTFETFKTVDTRNHRYHAGCIVVFLAAITLYKPNRVVLSSAVSCIRASYREFDCTSRATPKKTSDNLAMPVCAGHGRIGLPNILLQ